MRIIVSLILVCAMPLAKAKDLGDSGQVVTQAMTKVIPSLEHALQEYGPGDLAVFDLDNTVFREVQTLGTDEWYSHMIHRLAQKGIDRRLAAQYLEPINKLIKTQSRMKLMEEGLPKLIRSLQRRGVMVIGLTARHPNLSETTLHHLEELGVDFSLSGFPEVSGNRVADLPNEFLWSGGVAFTDGSHKGVVLKALVELTGVKPERIFAIDDRIHHVHSFVEAMLELGVEGRVVHYLRALQESKFNPRVADVQHRVFRKIGRILSDEEALKVLTPCERILTAI
jgi:hypothetical protein